MYEMTIRLRTGDKTCLYEQIYEHIKNEIREGKLLAGERLPSTRFLAEYLQVARSTVDYAYSQLLAEGYIESRPYRGYFVCPIEELMGLEDLGRGRPAGASEKVHRDDTDRTEAVKAASTTAASTADTGEESSSVDTSPYDLDFSPYDIDMSGFPFSVWKKLTKNILTYESSDLFSRGEAQGDYELRATISRYLHSSRGVNCRPEQIIVGAGNDYLLMLLEKILGRHVRIAMENPTYLRSYRIFQSFAYDIVTVDMDEYGMRVEPLVREGVRAAYVMPSHQFPTGLVMPIRRRLELLKWAAGASDRYLIEDDYDSEFRFRGKPIPALQASDELGKVIYLGSFSKAIAPAIRVSFMVLPDSLLQVYRRDCAFYSCTVSRIDQSILNEFIRDGYFERHLNKMRKIYRVKHDLMLEELQPFHKKFTVSGENAGLHLLLTAKGSASEEELVRRAAKQGVKVYGMSSGMTVNNPQAAAILLGFGGLSLEQIREGICRLKIAWEIEV
ncbi:MAG: PLP-dependent aminotransferase family protein [Acetatifactor sp.]|nr:PLP-dependent aminotransferase family protein [Acetatifactor sp.]